MDSGRHMLEVGRKKKKDARRALDWKSPDNIHLVYDLYPHHRPQSRSGHSPSAAFSLLYLYAFFLCWILSRSFYGGDGVAERLDCIADDAYY